MTQYTLSLYRKIKQTLKVETYPVGLLAPNTWALRAVQRPTVDRQNRVHPSNNILRADRPSGRNPLTKAHRKPRGPRAHGNPDIIHLPIGCRRASVSSRVPAAESSNSSSSHRRCTSTSVVRWRTSVPHTHTHTRRHERCPWCRRRRVSSSSNGGGTGQERYTGNTIHRGGSRVVAHHRAYQYGTRYIGRSHARTSTHAHTLSRAATAARARSRTRMHRRSGARAPTS